MAVLGVQAARQVDPACAPAWAWAQVPVWHQVLDARCIRRVRFPVVQADPEALAAPADVLASAHVPALVPAQGWADALAWVALAPA